MWRPFQSPYANSEWTLGFQSPERIEATAAGKSFLAVATSLRRLRLFTTAGMPYMIQILGSSLLRAHT